MFKKGQPSRNKGTGKGTDFYKLKYRTYKANAKKRHLPFEVLFDEFVGIIQQPCFYCGSPATGIDRMNNSLGYVKGNMLPCCGTCNRMKFTSSLQGFIQKCRKISSNFEQSSTVVGYEI